MIRLRNASKKGKEAEVKEIFDMDDRESLAGAQILDIREEMQYSTSTSIDDDRFMALKERTKILLEKLRRELEK